MDYAFAILHFGWIWCDYCTCRLVIALDTIGEDLTELVALYTTSTSFCCATLKNPFFVVSVHLFLYQIIWKVALFTMYVGADLDAMGATTGGGHLVINSCNEIFGACLHKTKFHRFPQKRAHRCEKYQY